MNITLSISCVGSINFINSIIAVVLIPSFQSFPSISSIPWSIVSLSPVPLIKSASYSLHSLSSDSINYICTSKFTISFQFIPPTKRFHCFHHEGRSHIWWKFLTVKHKIWWTSIIHIWLASIRHTWWTSIIFINDGHPQYMTSIIHDWRPPYMTDINNIWSLITTIIYWVIQIQMHTPFCLDLHWPASHYRSINW